MNATDRAGEDSTVQPFFLDCYSALCPKLYSFDSSILPGSNQIDEWVLEAGILERDPSLVVSRWLLEIFWLAVHWKWYCKNWSRMCQYLPTIMLTLCVRFLFLRPQTFTILSHRGRGGSALSYLGGNNRCRLVISNSTFTIYNDSVCTFWLFLLS